MSGDAERFTLREAQVELARRECAMHGHDWEIVGDGGGDPKALVCGRCGRSARVAATAYVVLGSVAYEGDTLYGAYGSQEAADAAVALLRDEGRAIGASVDEWRVEPVDLDAAPRSYHIYHDEHHDDLAGEPAAVDPPEDPRGPTLARGYRLRELLGDAPGEQTVAAAVLAGVDDGVDDLDVKITRREVERLRPLIGRRVAVSVDAATGLARVVDDEEPF